MAKLSEKVAIVTGGASGIGKATAELFARERARVVVADINASAAQEAASAINATGGTAIAVECDISREADVRKMVAATTERFGRVDVLVSSAARFLYKGGNDAGEKDWQETFATNVGGTALCCRYAAEEMKRVGGGAIVIVSSISGFIAGPAYATYNSSKAALLMLAKAFAIDFGDWNIRVNSISPGPVDTPAMHREMKRVKMSQAEFEAKMFEEQCLRRIVQSEDIAKCILFLVSDDAAVVTGTNLMADGGYLARN